MFVSDSICMLDHIIDIQRNCFECYEEQLGFQNNEKALEYILTLRPVLYVEFRSRRMQFKQ
jgi:hypothetical protein